MTQPVKINFKMYQGATFQETLRWESSTRIYKLISGITKSAPVEISTAQPHEIPEGWRVKITNVGGMREINSDETYHVVSNVLPGSFQINAINALGFSNYTGGGVVEYNQPVDLAGVTARMQLREKLESPTPILTLTTENGGIVVDNATKTIKIVVTAAQTALLNFTTAVYSLELEKSGVVTPFINGSIRLIKEVTR